MKTNRTCPVCGVAYYADTGRLKHGRQTTCSRACSYALRASKLSNKVGVTCATCGLHLQRSPSHVKGKYGSQFCSRACHYKGRSLGVTRRVVQKPYNISEEGRAAWREGTKKTRKTRIERNNYGHRQDTIAKLRQATTRAIAEGRIPARSEIEKEVRAFIESLGIAFFYQYPVRNSLGQYACVFDFFLPEHNTVVEINGTFWHSDPRFYPNGPVYASQQRTAIAWGRKMAIIENLGHELLVIWEHDIKEGGHEYLARVLAPLT